MVILGGTHPWKSTAVCKKFRRNLAVMFRAIVKWVAPNRVRALLERGDNQTKPCSIKNRRLKLRRPNMFIFWLVVLLTLRCFWQILLWDFGCVSPCLLWGYQIRPSSSVAAVVCHYVIVCVRFRFTSPNPFGATVFVFPSGEFISRQFRRKLFAQGRGFFWFSRRLPFRQHVFFGCISSDAPHRFLANIQKKRNIYTADVYIYIYIDISMKRL